MVRGPLSNPVRAALLAAALCAVPAMPRAQSDAPGGMRPPTGMSLARSTAMRFPQPVSAGSLLHRIVQQPVESQIILGHIHGIVRDHSGTVFAVMNLGRVYGYCGRLIAVPLDAMVLLGPVMEVVAYTPRTLRRFPHYDAGRFTPVPAGTVLDVGLAKPSH